MDLRQLEAFAYVVNLGSFSRAAQKLFLTQPTISAHISSLERELDAQLIVRTAKEAYPSEVGKVLYEYAQEMLSLRDNAIAACKGHQTNMSGTIQIAASTITYQYVLPRVMSEFRAKHSDIKFQILSCDSGGVVSNLLAGKAEIGMTGAMMDTAKCVYEEFMDDRLVVVTPNTEQYRKLGKDGFPLSELAKQPFILREPGSGTRKETEAFLIKMGINPASLNVAAQMDDPDAIKNSISQGLGISVMSQLAASDYERFGLVQSFGLEGAAISRKLYLVYHKSRPLSPVASAFMRFVSRYYAERPQTRLKNIT